MLPAMETVMRGDGTGEGTDITFTLAFAIVARIHATATEKKHIPD